MTPARRLRIRLRMATQHRPFWIEIQAALSLLAWGGYVLALPVPLGTVPAWTAVLYLPGANERMGAPAVLIGLLHLGCVLSCVRLARVAAAAGTATWFAFAARVSGGGGGPHPGIVLYWAPVLACGFAVPWLIYDWLRRR